ncbi:hypothetical protein BSL78_19097 [Apostichopus japonicus]|uniref:Peptidase A2 domain-containing protein n=1 Tax=Stichopus japonicus TaxID=307972 RepID=A0A2G8K7T1_STIJA|nr:hypothetical protein BSL78_19097 [Apostichopus japonicus]
MGEDESPSHDKRMAAVSFAETVGDKLSDTLESLSSAISKQTEAVEAVRKQQFEFNTRLERLEDQSARKGTFTKRPKRDSDRSHVLGDNCLELGSISETALVGNRPIVTVKLADVEIEAVIDTGSQVTIIPEQTFQEYLGHLPLEQLNWLNLRAANNTDIPYTGFFLSDVQLGGITIPERGILVVRLAKPGCMLIGMNVLNHCAPEQLAQLLELPSTHQPQIKAKVVQGVVKVAGSRKVRIPARSAIVVPVTGPVCSEAAEVIVEPVENLPAGVSVCCTLTFACKGRLNLQVVNLSEEEVWLNPRAPLGKLQYATMVDDGSVNFEGINRLNADINYIQMDREPDAESKVSKLLWSGLSSEQRQQAENLLRMNSDVFAASDTDLGYTDKVTHRIYLKDETPIKQPYRRIPPSQIEEVREHVRKLLGTGVIRESTSPFASPIVLVRKTDGSLRLCVDYRRLNEKTIKDSYPIPRIDESLDALHGAEWFSSIDLFGWLPPGGS